MPDGLHAATKGTWDRESLGLGKENKSTNVSSKEQIKESCDKMHLSVVTHTQIFIAANNSGLQNIFILGDGRRWTSRDSVQVAIADPTA